jgi:hypothetical protein
LKKHNLTTLFLIYLTFSCISIFSNIKIAQACGNGWWQESCNRGITITPTQREIDARAEKEANAILQGRKEGDAILAEKRAKQKIEDDAVNKANAETLANQEAAKVTADNINRQEAEEKLANQRREEKELNDKKNSALIQTGGNLLKLILNVK